MCMMGAETMALLKSEISKVWKAVKKYLVYIIIIAALFWPILAPFVISMLPASVAAVVGPLLATASYATWTDVVIAAAIRVTVAVAFGFLIDEEAAKKAVEFAFQTVGEVAQAVGELAGTIISSVGEGLFGKNWLWWLVGGVAGYLLLTSSPGGGSASYLVPAAPVDPDDDDESDVTDDYATS